MSDHDAVKSLTPPTKKIAESASEGAGGRSDPLPPSQQRALPPPPLKKRRVGGEERAQSSTNQQTANTQQQPPTESRSPETWRQEGDCTQQERGSQTEMDHEILAQDEKVYVKSKLREVLLAFQGAPEDQLVFKWSEVTQHLHDYAEKRKIKFTSGPDARFLYIGGDPLSVALRTNFLLSTSLESITRDQVIPYKSEKTLTVPAAERAESLDRALTEAGSEEGVDRRTAFVDEGNTLKLVSEFSLAVYNR